MTTQYINLFQHESKAAEEKRLGMLIRMVEPQPPAEANAMEPCQVGPDTLWWAGKETRHPDRGIIHDQRAVTNVALGKSWQSPFGPPGTVLHCREEWGIKKADFSAIVFRSDGDDSNVYVWRPAELLADESIRFRPTVGEVRCKQFGSLDEKDALAAGYKPFWDAENPVRHKMPDGKVITGEPAESAKEAMRHALKCDASTWLWLATLTQN